MLRMLLGVDAVGIAASLTVHACITVLTALCCLLSGKRVYRAEQPTTHMHTHTRAYLRTSRHDIL
jgi:hypothetical protein